MVKKVRSSTCSTGWCKNHVLELNPLHNNLYHRRNFRIRLCPRQNKQTARFENIMPIFNTDRKYYTPCFLLEEEKKYYIDNDERVMRNHENKIREDNNSNDTIYVPRHTRKRNYCFVCKTDYKEYIDHIDDAQHRRCLKNNTYTKYIEEIQQRFAFEKLLQQKKQEQLKKYAPTEQSCSISEQSPKSFDFIRKLSKPNEQLDLEPLNQIVIGQN